MYAFPFIVTAGLYIPYVTEGLDRQYENRTSTPIKASQKKKEGQGKNVTRLRNTKCQDHK